MRLIDVGDRAVAVAVDSATSGHGDRLRLVRGLRDALDRAAIAGVTDLVPSPGRVTVVYDPLKTDHEAVRGRVEAVVAAGVGAAAIEATTRHEIPVCYGDEHGPDLDEVAAAHGLAPDAVTAIHASAEYVVEALGFLPGFGYLAGMPPEIVTPRRSTPRRVVPAGSVGIGGAQTGAYPCASPGGWNLIGMTPTTLFDPTRPRPAVFEVGDRVRFAAIDREEYAGLRSRGGLHLPPRPRGTGITVIAPGLWTTVQDLGRPGHRASGVPLSGAADAAALRRANRLVGNPEWAAGLEITLLGPTLRFDRDTVVAVEGAEFPGLPSGRGVRVRAGETLTLGHATEGCRGELAVAGGIDVAPVLGSRSTFVPAGLGGLRGRPLAAGDVLPIGEPTAGPCGAAIARASSPGGSPADVTLRLIPGEQWGLAGDAFWSCRHRATSRSDRMGVRLDGPPLPAGAAAGSLESVAVLPGTVQLPPDGLPIILLVDAQTIGGYPVIGHVIAADLPRVAQLRPGDQVRWRPATMSEAHYALRVADEAAGGHA